MSNSCQGPVSWKMKLHGTRAGGGLEYIVDCFNGHYILYAAEQELVCVLLNSLHSTVSGEIKYCQTYILMTAFCRAVSCGE